MSNQSTPLELQPGEVSVWNEDARAFIVALIGTDLRDSTGAPVSHEARAAAGMHMADLLMIERRKRRPVTKTLKATKPVRESKEET